MFFTQQELEQLLENGRASRSSSGGVDHKPVAKLFTPDANCTLLITELSPDDNTIAFWLCDLGLGFPEIGYVSLKGLATVRGLIR